ALPEDQHWRMLAKSAMLDDLSGLQRSVTSECMVGGGDLSTSSQLIAAWRDRNHRAIERETQLLTELRAAPALDPAMLSVELRELADEGDPGLPVRGEGPAVRRALRRVGPARCRPRVELEIGGAVALDDHARAVDGDRLRGVQHLVRRDGIAGRKIDPDMARA